MDLVHPKSRCLKAQKAEKNRSAHLRRSVEAGVPNHKPWLWVHLWRVRLNEVSRLKTVIKSICSQNHLFHFSISHLSVFLSCFWKKRPLNSVPARATFPAYTICKVNRTPVGSRSPGSTACQEWLLMRKMILTVLTQWVLIVGFGWSSMSKTKTTLQEITIIIIIIIIIFIIAVTIIIKHVINHCPPKKEERNGPSCAEALGAGTQRGGPPLAISPHQTKPPLRRFGTSSPPKLRFTWPFWFFAPDCSSFLITCENMVEKEPR